MEELAKIDIRDEVKGYDAKTKRRPSLLVRSS